MRLKVLIVDDEKLERVLIGKGYKWEENGFEIIGEASSGEEALEFITRRKPHIVITDINMPYMDGLELAEKVKGYDWQPRIVIITGYREFDYARRAIKLGVKDFLLKPVNIQDMGETVQKLKEEIEQENLEKEAYTSLKEKALEEKDIVLESFLQRLVESRVEEEEILHKLQLYELQGLEKMCVCLDIKPNLGKELPEEEKYKINQEILTILKEFKRSNMFYFVHYMGNIILYFYEDIPQDVLGIAGEIKEKINTELALSVDIGISESKQGVEGISKAYRQAKKAINARAIFGKNSCISYEAYRKIKDMSEENIKMDWKEFTFSVQNGLYQKVKESISCYVEQIGRNCVEDVDYIKLMTMQMISTALSSFNKHGKSVKDLGNEEALYEEIAEIETLKEMKSYLCQKVSQIIEEHIQKGNKKRSPVIDQALNYIEQHLYDESLSLNRVAGEIFVNESYLSRIFKQEVGESLIGYIIRKRIEKSIEFLNTTDLRVYEIAEKVGIKDPHYFGICFKKQVGVTIKEYKQGK